MPSKELEPKEDPQAVFHLSQRLRPDRSPHLHQTPLRHRAEFLALGEAPARDPSFSVVGVRSLLLRFSGQAAVDPTDERPNPRVSGLAQRTELFEPDRRGPRPQQPQN